MNKIIKFKKFSYLLLPLFLLILSPLKGDIINLSNQSSIVTDKTSISLVKKDNETIQSILLTPDENNLSTQYEYKKNNSFSLNVNSYTEINQDDEDEEVLNIAFKALYAGAKLGTYISVTQSSDMEKFLISQGFKLNKGKIKLSTALLTKLSSLSSENYEFSDKVRLKQKTFGAEYSYKFFDKKSLLKEIKTSIVYYDIDGENLGNINTMITQNNIMEHGNSEYCNILNNDKISSDTTAILKLSSKLKVILGVNFHNNNTKWMNSHSFESKYRFNDYSEMSLYTGNDVLKNRAVGIKYSHHFRNSVNTFISAAKQYNDASRSENICRFGLRYSFGDREKASRLPRLFKEDTHLQNLTLSAIAPIDKVNVDDTM